MKYTILLFLFLAATANAALNCSTDNSASLTPLYNQTIINSVSIPAGSVVVTMGESNWHHISNELRPRSDITLINGAVGGCAIGGIARGQSKCWNTIPSNADVILLKPVNRSRGETASSYAAALESDTRRTLERIRDQRPNVSQVLLVSHHATPWSAPNNRGVPPKQGEPYSWWSGPIMQDVAANPPPNLGFSVTNWAYLWANGSYPRADGLQWSCDLFDNDGVHLHDPTGNRRAALEIDAALDNAIGGGNPPPDPPTSCEIRVANGDPNCRINWQGVCQCRG